MIGGIQNAGQVFAAPVGGFMGGGIKLSRCRVPVLENLPHSSKSDCERIGS